MATVTVSVPPQLKQKMASFPETNWSAVARRAILERINVLEKMDQLLAKSQLTEKDAIELGRKVRHGVTKRFLES